MKVRMLFLLSSVVVAMLVLVAMPKSAPAKGGGAIVVDTYTCILLDGDGNPVEVPSSHDVVTPSGNGNYSCKASVPPGSGHGAVHWDYANTGSSCDIPGAGTTTDWKETVTPSGEASLSCHVH